MEKRLKRILSVCILMVMSFTTICGCAGSAKYQKSTALDTAEEVSLTIAGSLKDFKALETVIQKFMEVYPNCNVQYEYIQDYNEMLGKRLTSEEDRVDLFMTDNIQSNSDFYPYALDLFSYNDKLNLSETYEGLINNYVLQDSTDKKELYAIPVGGEMRGMYVNKTLLNSTGIDTPKNRDEFLLACKTLKDKGYIPIQSNPGTFAQQLIYPLVAHTIAEADDHEAVYNMINNCDEGTAEYFREPLQFLYDITAAGYYEYKYVENEYGTFTKGNNEDSLQSFIGIVVADDGTFTSVPENGKAAFMTGANSMQSLLDKTIQDYHSDMEYEFILAPTGENGGYAHMSPAKAIAINKNSSHIDWSLEFLNFLFNEKNNKEFAEEYNIIPNTKDALQIISKKYDIPVDEITQPEDVTFDYGFYGIIVKPMVSISKANNPKYMKDAGDGKMVMYDFEYYMDELKTLIKEEREGGEDAVE